MTDVIHLAPRDDALDPLSLASIIEWTERTALHRSSRKKARATARRLADLVQWLWPGIETTEHPRRIELRAPEAELSIIVGEDRATVRAPRPSPGTGPRFGQTVVQALCHHTGWLAYDPQLQDVVEGVYLRCETCESFFGVRQPTCPQCHAAAEHRTLTWLEPTSRLPSSGESGSLNLAPLLWHYGLPARVLTDAVATAWEAELTRVASEVIPTSTPLEITVERCDTPSALDGLLDPVEQELDRRDPEPPSVPHPLEAVVGRRAINLDAFWCIKVVSTVTDPAREVAIEQISATFDDTEVDDELLFAVVLSPHARERGEMQTRQYPFLPQPLWQPQLAGPLWAALRPMLQRLAEDVGSGR